ncbi:hypothetical protein Dda_1384 [Drechslerella dactyloides]|uniref:Uncharacterized protein n=1 Tax=Drechslerella dactyloides TaxID=74499 RepID=A0AAD6J645_DREDA|nr:hypothetical protein Dda_1384 [Drechslerella dactyloides]
MLTAPGNEPAGEIGPRWAGNTTRRDTPALRAGPTFATTTATTTTSSSAGLQGFSLSAGRHQTSPCRRSRTRRNGARREQHGAVALASLGDSVEKSGRWRLAPLKRRETQAKRP